MARPTFEMNTKPDLPLQWLYGNVAGRALLRLAVSPRISQLGGLYMNSPLSQRRILPFIQKANVDMTEYEPASYGSYNDFFTRKIRPSARPIHTDPSCLISPCDARLCAYRLRRDRLFPVKGVPYRLSELLQNDVLSRAYENGICLIFRLAVDDYHRYCFPDDGTCEPPVHIDGVFHTVQPVATERYPVYHRNTREYTVLHTAHFGDVIQMEVGALLVGKICNHAEITAFARGDEKGYFEFGGSTVILLLKPDALELDAEFFENTRQGLETRVWQGEAIGHIPPQ